MFLKQFLSVKMTTSLIIAVSSRTKQKTADLTLGNYPTKILYKKQNKKVHHWPTIQQWYILNNEMTISSATNIS